MNKQNEQKPIIKDVKDWEVEEIFNESDSVSEEELEKLLAEEEAQYEEKG